MVMSGLNTVDSWYYRYLGSYVSMSHMHQPLGQENTKRWPLHRADAGNETFSETDSALNIKLYSFQDDVLLLVDNLDNLGIP